MQSRKSLQDKAYEYLKAQIMDGAFEKGKIYSLAAITASLNMSRTPVRDALLSLSQENLVDVLPSRGFQLHEVTRREIIELYQLRCAIEGYCAAFLSSCYAADPSRSEIAMLDKNLKLQEKAVYDHQSADEYYILDMEFHNIIISSTKNKHFYHIIKNNRVRSSDFSLVSLRKEGVIERTLKEHKAIYEALCTGDPVLSQEKMILHLDTPLQNNLSSKLLTD
ncbi:GntR family transcriptional regulator [Megasphaera sp. UBA4382]|uniref:GntR family transcriptional regulator n=1 Tax=Megasphaera sp. UBA4382 TaxID=1946850 RepID=UPI0025C2F006|nr:GntR family transcriptional regulator [Megasphaera sp. UBA4382]